MCSTNQNSMMSSYGMKMPNLAPYFQFLPSSSQLSALDFQRFQMLSYSPRMQLGLHGYPANLGMLPYSGQLMDSYTQACLYKHDLRASYIQEEPKPSYSYIALISMAILGSKDSKLVLGDIYQWILDNYSYFRTRGTGWRNSIRHNLSLNECFVKSGRSANGKGHYWAVHEANVQDFKQGDFRRRRAQRKVRRYMGLSIPGEDEDDSPCSSPTPAPNWAGRSFEERQNQKSSVNSVNENKKTENAELLESVDKSTFDSNESNEESDISIESCEHYKERENVTVPILKSPVEAEVPQRSVVTQPTKKRLFDIDSLLAPDPKRVCVQSPREFVSNENKMQWTKLWTIYHKQFKPSDLKVLT